MKVNIDLREEFTDLLSNYGKDVLYFRKSKKIKCDCYSELNKSGTAECPLCMGTGWKFAIENIEVIEQDVFSRLTSTDLGESHKSVIRMYVDFKVMPKVSDHIILVQFEGSSPKILIKVMHIVSLKPIHGDNGRVEFYEIACEARTDLYSKYSKLIEQISCSEIRKGKRYYAR